MVQIDGKSEIISNINELRTTMIKIGETKGLNNPETVACSQELDRLLINYQRKLFNLE
ncbi:Spo0E family sporulation regulatory protein-aspartic acid phosphatase [Anaerobacillus sp. MEB173]|uniref:Spo0E family sporulation regulatory protein-aspartic acid phosphatase n=1 Tax=Anaerobacillus sp. MEB173 TaxID=3383345 RepID=UPI003F8F4978